MRRRGDPGPRRRRLRRRPPGRALLPRRARDHALRGHVADPEADHRPRDDRHQRADPLETLASQCRAGRRTPGHRRRRRRDDGRGHRAARGARPARGRCCTTPAEVAVERGARRDRRRARALARQGPPRAASRGEVERRGARSRTSRECRADHRGRARAPGAQARAVRARSSEIAPGAVLASNTSSIPITAIARRGRRPRARRRHALLQPGAGDEARRGHRRACDSSRGGAGGRARDRRGDGQARHRRHRRAGLPGQPLQPARSAWRRCGCCRSGSPTSRRSTRSSARAGFRMGPFELQDLVGIDVGYEVSLSPSTS